MKRLALVLSLLAFPSAAQQVTSFPPAYLPLTGSETVYLVQNGIGKQTTVGNLVSGGFSGSFASPPPIGNVAPNTGAFTTISASSSISGAGFAAYLASPPTIGGTTPGQIFATKFESKAGANLIISPGGSGHTITFGDPSYGVGSAGFITMGPSASGALWVDNGTFQSQFFATPGNSYAQSGSSSTNIMNLIANYSGTSSTTQNPFVLQIPSDTVSGGGLAVLTVVDNLNTGATNGRIGINNILNINSPIVGDFTAQQYQPIYNQFASFANAGGTSPSNPRGFAYGQGSQVFLHPGATFYALANGGGEDDLAVETGASVRDEILHDGALLATHAVAGTRLNIGFGILSQVGAVGTVHDAWTAGGPDGPWPMASTGAFVSTIPQVACGNGNKTCEFPPQLLTYGDNFQFVNFSQQSGYSYFAPGAYVDGTGQILASQGLLLGRSGTNYTVDIPNVFAVNSVVVNVAGLPTVSANVSSGNYYPSDIVYGSGTPPGQYAIATTKVISGAVSAGGSGGVTGPTTCTVIGTTGTGTKFQASVTVSGGIMTAINSISTSGSYTVNPSNLTAEAVVNQSGCGSITGAKIAIGVGAATITILVPDVFASNITAISPTGGSGFGLSFTATNQTRAGIAIAPTGATSLSLSGGSTQNITLGSSFYDSCTALTTTSAGLLGCTTSDQRLKTDDGIITGEEGVTTIMALPDAHRFHYKIGKGPAGQMQGFFAQDIQKTRPDLVSKGGATDVTPDGTLRFDQVALIPDLVAAIKSQQAEIITLRSELARAIKTPKWLH